MITTNNLQTFPKADSSVQIVGDNYRFTLLTSRLIRIEYNEEGVFEDRASQIVINREFRHPEFTVETIASELIITTSELKIRYDQKPFSRSGLTIQIKDISGKYLSTWHYGEKPKDLKGTARTLDDVNGAVELESGILSKEGYGILDDSSSLVLTEENWISPRKGKVEDFYFFGYGRDYFSALQDFYKLTGPTPLLPRFTLGNWWSRYHPYSETDYKELMSRFKKEQIPFSVSVIDMDWHLTDVSPEYGSGWTGYTWNKELFPNPQKFLDWLHKENLKVTLNLHPADGIHPGEEMYSQMIEALNLSKEYQEIIPFDITNADFAKAYFEVLHHPYEKIGVDFWWVDWQQGKNTKLSGLDPLWMLNHYHYLDIGKDNRRPLTFSRYAGPGSHRYPIGFSGDTHATWESLEFQPYFTANASNIGYGWWSHDIGGHMLGYKDDEMVTRWIQFGTFSPINRLHSSDNIFSGKEPWKYAKPYEESIKEALKFRHQLLPFLYTMNRRAHTEGRPIISPLYYFEPWQEDAYEFKNQYYFGEELLVAPITTPVNKTTQSGSVDVWIPEGEWVDIFTGNIYEGGTRKTLHRTISEIPVLAKMGSILPLQNMSEFTNSICNPESIELKIFSGKGGSFRMWEDSNEELASEDTWVNTDYTLLWSDKPIFTVSPAEGDLSSIPESRNYTFSFVNVPNQQVTVLVNGLVVEHKANWRNYCLKIKVDNIAVTDKVEVILTTDKLQMKPMLDNVYEFLDKTQFSFDNKLMLYNMIEESKSITKIITNLESRSLENEMFSALLELVTLTY